MEPRDEMDEALDERRRDAPRLSLQVVSLLVSLLTAAGMGVVTIRVQPLTVDPTARPDPFTGTMGRELEARVDRRIEATHKRIEVIEPTVSTLAQESRERLARMEATLQAYAEQLRQINDLLRTNR